MIVWHKVFRIGAGHFLLLPEFKFQVVSLDKNSNYLSCCEL